MGWEKWTIRWLWPIGLALLLALVVATAHYRWLQTRQYTLQLEVASTHNGLAQLFYDSGNGFNAKDLDSIAISQSDEFVVRQFKLPQGKYYRLRLDPLERPGTFRFRNIQLLDNRGNIVLKIPPNHVRPLHDIANLEVSGNEVRMRTRDATTNPSIELLLDRPLNLRKRHPAALVIREGLGVFAAVLLGMMLLRLVARSRLRKPWQRTCEAALRKVDLVAAWLSRPELMSFDRAAVTFLIVVSGVTLALAACGISGSSIGMLQESVNPAGSSQGILAGHSQPIRMDEWGCQTPAMLYQALREDALSVKDSTFGPGNAALLGNIPCRHVTTLFRPQFWGFFVLPVRYGFAFYWQFKNWVVLCGMFLLFKLFTRSTWLAIFGALWVYFSAYTQWFFSTPECLPEMMGLSALTVCGACYLLVGTEPRWLFTAAVLTAMAAVDFALCLYLPFLVPFSWVALALVAGFVIARRKDIFRAGGLKCRVLAAAACTGLIGAALLLFLHDARGAIHAIGGTVYPGTRRSGGGIVPMAEMVFHLANVWASGERVPVVLQNACVASGFCWFAPVAILLWSRLAKRRPLEVLDWTFITGSVVFLLLLTWVVMPIPQWIGQWFFLTFGNSERCMGALGIINVLLTLQCLAISPPPADFRRGRTWLKYVGMLAGVYVIVLWIFSLANGELQHFFTRLELLLGALLVAGMVFFLITGRRAFFAVLLLSSLIWAHLLVNPVVRGFPGLDQSALPAVARRDDLRRGSWLIYDSTPWAASWFYAQGFKVFNTCRFVPDLAAMRLLDPDGKYNNVYDRASYMPARPAAPGEPAAFTLDGVFVVQLSVSPADPRLRSLGIRYEAFAQRPDDTLAPPGKLRPLYDHAIDGFWLYELEPPGQSGATNTQE